MLPRVLPAARPIVPLLRPGSRSGKIARKRDLVLKTDCQELDRIPHSNANELAAFTKALIARINPERYRIWFQNRTVFTISDDQLIVGVPNLHVQEWLQSQFQADVEAAAREAIGQPLAVRFRIDPVLFRAGRARQQLIAEQAKQGVLAPKPPTSETAPKHRTLFDELAERNATQSEAAVRRRWRRLSDFVVGPSNRVAHASAQAVIETPGQGPNPLVIHGPVGTGKTHLLEGVYVGLRRRWPALRVLFITAEDFTNRFVAACRFGKQGSFRKHFRSCDAFLIDDVDFLARKRATQIEFLHTFDALIEAGKQVVMTCDCHPRLNDDFSPELVDRLLGGAIWGLMPPDMETRLSLLRSKLHPARPLAAESAIVLPPIPEDVLKFVAENLRGNVRELEGALHCLRHFSRVANRPVDLPMAREALGDLLRHAVRSVRLADVDRAVCTVLQIPAGTLQTRQRVWAVSHARMLAIYLSRKLTSASFGEIGNHFGGQSHSAAIAAEKKVRKWIEDDAPMTAGGREWTVRELAERVERELQR